MAPGLRPTPARRVSRIVALAATGTAVYAQLIERGRHRLLRFDGEVTEDVPGWPADSPIVGLAAYRGAVYALVREAGGVSVWRSDGRRSARLFGPRPRWHARAIAAGTQGLWAVSAEDRGGTLWHSTDGTDWRPVGALRHGKPEEIAVTADGVYVTGAGDDGRGILWGPGAGLGRPAPGVADASRAELPRAELPHAPAQAVDLDALGRRLERALQEPESYAGHGAILRDLVHAAARAGAPAEFFSDRLTRPMARQEL